MLLYAAGLAVLRLATAPEPILSGYCDSVIIMAQIQSFIMAQTARMAYTA